MMKSVQRDVLVEIKIPMRLIMLMEIYYAELLLCIPRFPLANALEPPSLFELVSSGKL